MNELDYDPIEVIRINHLPEIMSKKKIGRTRGIKLLTMYAGLSWPSAAKWMDGRTDVNLETLERIAAWLGLSKDDVLETIKK